MRAKGQCDRIICSCSFGEGQNVYLAICGNCGCRAGPSRVRADGAAGAAPPFTFDNPDYNFKSLRVNAVLRWEIRPGSNFYAVWTRQQQDFSNPGVFAPGRDIPAMLGAHGDDVILFKIAYWIGR